MALLSNLPSELQLRIAGFVRASPEPFKNLKSLALVCRTLAPIAREALLREAAISIDGYHWGDGHPELNQGDRALLLHQLLKAHRGIDRKMLSLAIYLRDDNDLDYWFDRVATRSLKYAAGLLSAAPGLNNLTILLQGPFESEYVDALYGGLFDIVWPHIECMPHLRTLKTNFLPPRSIVLKLPSLQTLHIDMKVDDLESGVVVDTFEAMLDDEEAKPASTALNIILDIDPNLLSEETSYIGQRTIKDSIADYLARLVNIDSLQIRWRCRPSWYEEHQAFPMRFREVYYNGIMQLLTLDLQLEALVIDTCDIEWEKCATGNVPEGESLDLLVSQRQRALHRGIHHNKLQYTHGLHRFVVPQAALLCCEGPRYTQNLERTEFQIITLPPTVESIEIIDSTRALNRWARYVLEHPAEYPCLKTIILWCDRYTEPLGEDECIRPVGELCEDCKHEEWKLEVEMSDDVWDEIKKAGIALVVHTERQQGWRRIS